MLSYLWAHRTWDVTSECEQVREFAVTAHAGQL
jgi:hypothetical protein